jgi:hypothetical protein
MNQLVELLLPNRPDGPSLVISDQWRVVSDLLPWDSSIYERARWTSFNSALSSEKLRTLQTPNKVNRQIIDVWDEDL